MFQEDRSRSPAYSFPTEMSFVTFKEVFYFKLAQRHFEGIIVYQLLVLRYVLVKEDALVVLV